MGVLIFFDKILVGLIDVTISYVIYKSKNIVANGNITYNVSSGKIDDSKFICNIISEKDTNITDVKRFLENIIILFGKINYIAKKNATQKKEHKVYFDADVDAGTKLNWLNEKGKDKNTANQGRNVEFQFQEKLEQPIHVPKEKKDSKKIKDRKKSISQHKSNNQKCHIKKVVYKIETWERAGYYTSNGTYVPPCTIHRHPKTKVS